jgi:signal transduction histidine kinase
MNNDVLEFPNEIAGGTLWTHDVIARATERIQRWARRPSMQLHCAVERMPPDSPNKRSLNGALSLMQRVLNDGPLALPGLHSSGAAPETLEQALCGLRDELTPDGLLLRIFVTGKSRALKPDIQEQIYLIGREALINAIRHSNATSIEAEIEYLPRRLRMVVRDNGCGIDSQVVRSGQVSHLGLLGMRERAENMGAQLRIRSRPGAGTEVEISVPVDSVAYA